MSVRTVASIAPLSMEAQTYQKGANKLATVHTQGDITRGVHTGQHGSSPPTIASVLEKRQSALQKSRIDRGATQPTAHRRGLELSTGTGLYGACRSTQCGLAVWSR